MSKRIRRATRPIYMICTNDSLSLPLFVGTMPECAEYLGCSMSNLSHTLQRKHRGGTRNPSSTFDIEVVGYVPPGMADNGKWVDTTIYPEPQGGAHARTA